MAAIIRRVTSRPGTSVRQWPWPAIAALALVPLSVASAHVSVAAFYVAGLLLLVASGVCTWRWPRAMVVLLILTPILDRYLVSLVMPPTTQEVTNYSSEALLVVTAPTLGV